MKHVLVALLVSCNFICGAQNSGFDLKKVEKTLVKLNDSLHASKFEVSNQDYTAFLQSLLRENRSDEHQTADIVANGWADELSYNEPYVKHYHTHDAYSGYPVVNISYEGAILFCDWMTEQYNAHPKKEFTKVRFRLPTEEEWTMAAKGGNPDAVYPWKGTQLQNSKGEIMANFRSGQGDEMGIAGDLKSNADVTAPVESYQPNGYGLYNMAGNVAEMTAEKGLAKGGSWRDPDKALQIDSDGNYERPSAFVGFRYFMEVIEE